MAGGCTWSRRVSARTRTLRTLVRDTQRALHDVSDIIHIDPEITISVQEIGSLSSRSTALVILGTSFAARARLLHYLLGRRLLPDDIPRGCRWLRIQYGITTQVHLTLGNSEFELVEELECNKRPWETIPVQDLIRQDQTDMATMLEIEINNSFLKDGLRIIVPPDIESNPGTADLATLKKLHSELYKKRDLILRNFNPIYLCAIDKVGKSVFSDNVCESMVVSRSDEDFWSTFNLYQMARQDEFGAERLSNRVVERCDGVFRKSGDESVFNSEACLDLRQVKEINSNAQVLFILFSDSVDVEAKRKESVGDSGESTESTEDRVYRTEDLPESDQDLKGRLREESSEEGLESRGLQDQMAFMNDLLDQWELMCSPSSKHSSKSQWLILDTSCPEGEKKARPRHERVTLVTSHSVLLSQVFKFAADAMQGYLLDYSSQLTEIHVKLVQQLILASFDMARELQVVPRKIQYVASQEHQLYQSINEKFSEGEHKQQLVLMMQELLLEIKAEIQTMDWSVDDLPWHRQSLAVSTSICSPVEKRLPPVPPVPSVPSVPIADDVPSDGEEASTESCHYTFDDYDIVDSMEHFTVNPYDDSVNRIPVANEEWGSTRSIRSTATTTTTACTATGNISIKQASLDVRQTVLSKLSRKISMKLVKFVDCLKDTYFGTLQRCLESLEQSCRHELGGRPASEAMRRLVAVPRQVDLQPCANFSVMRALLDSVRRLLCRLRAGGGEHGSCCALSPGWRREVALHTAHSLSPQRLAALISTQILERLSEAHERYQSALGSLECALASRLHHTEDVKLAIRKKFAPLFARLCLESTSMCDLLMHGAPELAREIGRGQYGVVYAVRGAWAGHSPVAVKSVLPADERHYHELAMEFFYTRSIPLHPRIVRLHGSIVQRVEGAASVLLLSERKARDLHAAVRAGLSLATRLAIACDIVDGIRYLHSLGLVHRDIKMKNVLLDHQDRAALSDLGFCTAEALMSGSVVGTPVHMAPELLAGDYDATVDVYAFGILFWYVCAGNVKLPTAFEVFQNKEQLWSKVKRGLRPERLPQFSDECWEIMESCWASEPSQRALLGDIQPKLRRALDHARAQPPTPPPHHSHSHSQSDDDSLDFRDCL